MIKMTALLYPQITYLDIWNNRQIIVKLRMTTFIKAKLGKSEDQMNIDKYKVELSVSSSDGPTLIIKSFAFKQK